VVGVGIRARCSRPCIDLQATVVPLNDRYVAEKNLYTAQSHARTIAMGVSPAESVASDGDNRVPTGIVDPN
jgi:hypothetical protein